MSLLAMIKPNGPSGFGYGSTAEEARPPDFVRLTDLPMLWSEQWRAIGLQAPAQVRAELR